MDAGTDALKTSLLSIQGAQPKAPAKGLDLVKAREAAEEFEAVFLSQMLNNMFAGIKTDKMFGGGHGEDAYRAMMVQEYGKAMSVNGGVGIADAVMREIIQLQEAQSK
ncbi:MAG TPA: rod-binding protein [Alphaproteobacteria bacterium]|nr:rod-binding protein [Alphaproteobacteria bacterium]